MSDDSGDSVRQGGGMLHNGIYSDALMSDASRDSVRQGGGIF